MSSEKFEIFLSKEAVSEIKRQLEAKKCIYFRVGVKGGKCAGLNYIIELSNTFISEKDNLINVDGILIIVDNKSAKYINGLIISWESTLMYIGFKFNNPLATSTCGCGQSFEYQR